MTDLLDTELLRKMKVLSFSLAYIGKVKFILCGETAINYSPIFVHKISVSTF